MIGYGWLTLKQAHEALRAGRLDEAHQLLVQPQIQGHRRCLELLQQLMRAFVERGEKHLRNDDTAKAWADLLKAEQIGITDNAPLRLRQALRPGCRGPAGLRSASARKAARRTPARRAAHHAADAGTDQRLRRSTLSNAADPREHRPEPAVQRRNERPRVPGQGPGHDRWTSLQRLRRALRVRESSRMFAVTAAIPNQSKDQRA